MKPFFRATSLSPFLFWAIKLSATISYEKYWSLDEWERLPKGLLFRQIKVTVDLPGFRVSSFYIVTTLLDVEAYSANDIADLYFQ